MLHFPESFSIRKTTIPMLEKLFEKYMDPIVAFTRKQCPEPVKTVDNNLVASLMRIMDCFFA
jgi:dynein heavy chain